MCRFFFSSRRRHTRFDCDWSSDVCSSDLDRHQLRGAHVPHVDHLGHELVRGGAHAVGQVDGRDLARVGIGEDLDRSEERRVGKECRFRWWLYHYKKRVVLIVSKMNMMLLN